jgi:hypothetical protein
VRSITTSSAGREIDSVTISVTNETTQRLQPHFLVNTATNENDEGFWTPSKRGVVALGPHDSETVTLYPPASAASPKHGAHWLVEAYTSDPSWLSTSPFVTFPPS